MIFDKILYNESDAEATVVAYSNVYILRRVDIYGTENQCLMYALNVLYKDVDDLKKASVLWNAVDKSKKPKIRCNDNAFFFNTMLGCNTSFYDNDTNDWYLMKLIKKQQYVISSSVKSILNTFNQFVLIMMTIL